MTNVASFEPYLLDLDRASTLTVAGVMSLDCPRATATASTQQSIVVDLDHELARRADSQRRQGGRARQSQGGWALRVARVRRDDRRHAAISPPAPPDDGTPTALHEAWKALSDTGRRALVVRSSSTVEDGGSQSMAGLFTSVLDVQGWEAFLAAVDEVVRSGGEAPIAVLVQPFLRPTWGGVLFGADPVTGRTDRLVVAAVPGGPDRLVSGQVDGVQLTLTPRGRLDEAGGDVPAALRARRTRRQLVGLARRTAQTFGGPQDIEWAIDAGGTHRAAAEPPDHRRRRRGSGRPARCSGPGPVAETFGLPLRPLEVDLWVDPMRDGVREALRITGARSPRQLRRSPAVVTVGGRVAADLDLLGLVPRRRSLWSRINPRPPGPASEGCMAGRAAARRPAGAGRRRARRGRRRPRARCRRSTTLTDAELVRLLRRSRQTLPALHGHEVLAGMLLDDARCATHRGVGGACASSPRRPVDGATTTSSSPATRCCSASCHRASAAPVSLPPPPASPPVAAPAAAGRRGGGAGGPATAGPLGPGAHGAGRARARRTARRPRRADRAPKPSPACGSTSWLRSPSRAARCRFARLREGVEPGPPLPASFRLTDDGIVVPVGTGGGDAGRGAGGGRGTGPVHIGTESRPGAG